jgi:hypothetical protein
MLHKYLKEEDYNIITKIVCHFERRENFSLEHSEKIYTRQVGDISVYRSLPLFEMTSFNNYLHHHIHNPAFNHNHLFRLFGIKVALHIGDS